MSSEGSYNSSHLTGTASESQAESTPSEMSEAAAPEAPAEADLESKQAEASPADSGEVGALLEDMETVSAMTPGEIARGTVLNITDTEVMVDVGLKSEAAIARDEFLTEDGQLTVAPGDTIDVWVDHYDEAAGTVTLSYRRAARLRAWEEVERAFQEQMPLRARIIERIKGGLMVDVGVRAFLPASHADIRPHPNLDGLLGQEITCKVIKLNRKRNNVVVSRRQALEDEINQRKTELREKLIEGAELVGRVKNLTDYGVFVDLGGIDGLLHITDLSWGRVGHPSEVVQVGQEIRVRVLKYNPEKERVSLGLKQLTPDPWEMVPVTYHPGDRFTGRVVSITDYGAFVELEPGVEGLIHISEMTWSRRLRHPSKIVKAGDRVEVAVLDVNAPQRRISLSLRHTLPDPWTTLSERYSEGSVVQGRVRNLTDFGAFVEIEDGVDGLIHLSNMSWAHDIKHPSEVLKKGQKVEAVILNLDPARRRLSLGLKQMEPSPWDELMANTQAGDILPGRVTRTTSFGAFVELAEGVEGLCHVSEYGHNHASGAVRQLKVGSELNFRVIRMNPEEKRIGLSLKDVEQPPEPLVTASGGIREGVGGEAQSSDAATSEESAPPLPTAQSDS